MLRARAGDREAFARVVERHQEKLVNLFRRLGVDVHGAEDCAQETFLRLFRSLDRYSPRAPFAAFLYTIARHVWVDGTRRAARHFEETREVLEAPEKEPAVRPDTRLDLRAAVAALPEHLRLVVVLGVDEGLSYAEIGAVLGIPEGTVKSRMFHAVRALRETLHAEADR